MIDIDNVEHHLSMKMKVGHNIIFVSHIHIPILAVNKVVCLKAIARLNNNVGEVNDNIAHTDGSTLDNRP